MDKKFLGAWIVVFLLAVGYFVLTYGGLPETVASHFDGAGHPNGFQTKDGYLAFFVTMVLFVNGLFSALYFVPGRIPTSLINIPWKAYWLSTEERKAQLFGRLRLIACLMGTFVNSVFLFTDQVIYQQNVPNPFWAIPINGGVTVILSLAAFLVVLVMAIAKPTAPHQG